LYLRRLPQSTRPLPRPPHRHSAEGRHNPQAPQAIEPHFHTKNFPTAFPPSAWLYLFPRFFLPAPPNPRLLHHLPDSPTFPGYKIAASVPPLRHHESLFPASVSRHEFRRNSRAQRRSVHSISVPPTVFPQNAAPTGYPRPRYARLGLGAATSHSFSARENKQTKDPFK
jgi:hypothetical protein